MFGGVHRTATIAAWGETPAQARITAASKLGFENYQTPSFSYKIFDDSRTQWQINDTAEVDITTAVANQKGFVLATTFYMDWIEEEIDPPDENVIYGFVHDLQLKTENYSGFWAINMFLQLREGRLNITSRLEGDSIARITKDLPGVWQDYNNRWMTLIYASSSDPADFANYNPESGTAEFGVWNTRSTLYDTETGAVIQSLDFVPDQGFDFPQVAEWPYVSGEPAPVAMNKSGTWGITVGGSWGGDPVPQAYRLGNIWGSLGMVFDPLVYGNQLLTTRPSQTIAGVQAWYNIQFADYVAGAGSDPYYIPLSGDDWMSAANGRALDLTYGNNVTDFTAGYSDTIIPKNRNQ